ncbi:MAG: 5-formyltetrahydrofolate cyclo-ligase [Erysipelotrichaceae bacterium]|nr:5-formyltetrahydrofolate cyclo-ligase [Erysipelotrichaceae bacterium]
MSDKKELRKRYKKILGSLSEEERASYSRIICEKLSSLVKGKIFLSYSPIGKEVDVSRINELYLPAYPRVLKDHQMEARLPKDSRFLISRYGIAEPDPDHSILIDKKKLEVILVPLVAFHESKIRLGHGGGYYDRYLKNTDALKIGVAYEIQKTEEDFSQMHDIPLDMIVTEKSIY